MLSRRLSAVVLSAALLLALSACAPDEPRGGLHRRPAGALPGRPPGGGTFHSADEGRDMSLEELLREAAGTNEDHGYEVPRLRDGGVEGYGTFSVSGGAYDYGYGLLAFAEDAWSIRRPASRETAAGEAEFPLALDRQSAKPDARWLDCTPENLEAALSAPLPPSGSGWASGTGSAIPSGFPPPSPRATSRTPRRSTRSTRP